MTKLITKLTVSAYLNNGTKVSLFSVPPGTRADRFQTFDQAFTFSIPRDQISQYVGTGNRIRFAVVAQSSGNTANCQKTVQLVGLAAASTCYVRSFVYLPWQRESA